MTAARPKGLPYCGLDSEARSASDVCKVKTEGLEEEVPDDEVLIWPLKTAAKSADCQVETLIA